MNYKIHAMLLFTAVFFGCGKAPEKRPIPSKIDRVVSMAPSLTECLFAIDAGEKVVGVTTFCTFPEEAKALPRIGGYNDANYEMIYTLKPDLAVMLDVHVTAAERLTELGIAHVQLSTSTIPDILNTLSTLGTLLHKEQAATDTIDAINKRIGEIRQITQDTPKRKVLISIGRNMGTGGLSDVYVAGKNTMYNEMLDIIGAENVYSGKLDYACMSREAIMQLAPDVIIDLVPDLKASRKMTPEEVSSEWDILNHIPAVKNGRVHVLDKEYICIPGPRFIKTLEDITRVVYPESFKP